MRQGQATLTPEQMATLAVNVLNQQILEAARTDAKQLYRRLEERQPAPLTHLKTEDGGLIQVICRLDADAFVGALNFSSFRDGLLALLAQLTETLRAEKPIKTFSPMVDEGADVGADVPSRLFAVGGVTNHDGQVNVLMLGVTPEPQRPVLTLQLVYVDPGQFQAEASTS